MITAAHAFLLIFYICTPPEGEHDSCSEGEIRAASCELAAHTLRQGTRSGYEIYVLLCRKAPL